MSDRACPNPEPHEPHGWSADTIEWCPGLPEERQVTDRDEFYEILAKLQAQMEKKTFWNSLYRHNERYEKAFVENDETRIRGLRRRRIAASVLALAVLVTLPWIYLRAPALLSVAGSCIVAFFVVQGAWVLGWRAMAYRSGWLAGRRELYAALREAEGRGLTSQEFLQAQTERDFSVTW